MKKFVISTDSYRFNVGGLKVLHKLCHLLNECGAEAYLAPILNHGRNPLPYGSSFYVCQDYNTPIIDVNSLDPDTFIAIYPESWYGNHTKSKHVIRWLIGPPDANCISTWKDTDVWFWYVPLYQQPKYNPNNYNKNMDNFLYVAEFHENIFYDRKQARTSTCWALRKAQGPIQQIHPEDSIFIPYHQFDTYEIFNQCTTFYCYDQYTFLPIQALMCGCDSVVAIKDGLSHDDFLNGYMLNKYVAYGLDDIERAKSIKHEFPAEINRITNQTKEDVRLFIEKCNDYFK